jgi:hypothetical protein
MALSPFLKGWLLSQWRLGWGFKLKVRCQYLTIDYAVLQHEAAKGDIPEVALLKKRERFDEEF